MSETIPKGLPLESVDPAVPEPSLVAPTGLVPFVKLGPGEHMPGAGPEPVYDVTTSLPALPTETMAAVPESLPARRLRLSSEIGAVSLGNFVPRPIKEAATAIKGLWRTLTASHEDAAARYDQKAERAAKTQGIMQESSQAAFDQRGNRAILPGANLPGNSEKHPGPLVELRPQTFGERRYHMQSWRTKGGIRARQNTSNSAAAIYDRKDAEGKSYLGTERYFEEIEASGLDSRAKKAAIKAGKDYNKWQGKNTAAKQQLKAGAQGTDKAGQAAARRTAEYQRRAEVERAAASRKKR